MVISKKKTFEIMTKPAHKIASSCRPNLFQDIFRTEGDIKI